jgi:hypothetical protein
MTISPRTVAGMALALAAALPCFSQDDVRIEAQVKAWFPGVFGELQFKEPPRTSSVFSFDKDLGITDVFVSPMAEVGVCFGRERLDLRYEYLHVSASKIFTTNKVHKGDFFPAGEKNNTDILMQQIYVDYSHIVASTDVFHLAVGLSLHFITFDLEIQGPSNPSNDETIGAFVPEVTVRADAELCSGLVFQADFAVGVIDAAYVYAQTFSTDWGLYWALGSGFRIAAGYRFEFQTSNIDRPDTQERHRTTLLMGGPFLLVEARF